MEKSNPRENKTRDGGGRVSFALLHNQPLLSHIKEGGNMKGLSEYGVKKTKREGSLLHLYVSLYMEKVEAQRLVDIIRVKS